MKIYDKGTSHFTQARSVWLFLLALGPRLLYLASIPQQAIVEAIDAQGYALLAHNLLAGRGFSLQGSPPYRPDGLRTPLYPLLISGVHALAGENPLVVAVFQALLDSLTTWLVFKIGQALLGSRAGIVAAVIYALTPMQWRYAAALLTEIPLAFLVTWAVWLLTKSPTAGWALACGSVAGLAALCKPNVAGLALLLAVGALWGLRTSRRHAWICAGLVLLSAALVVSPWLLRNWRVFERPFLSNADLGFVGRVSAPAALGVVRDHEVQPWSPEWEARYIEVVSRAAARYNWQLPANKLTPYQADQRELQVAEAAWEVLLAHPLRALQAHLVGFARSWAPQEQAFWYTHLSSVPWERSQVAANTLRDAVEILCDGRPGEAFDVAFIRPWPKLDALGRVLWYGWSLAHLLGAGLALLGLWQLRRQPALAFVLLAIVLYATLPPGPIGYERFRVPVMPLITLLEMAGLAAIHPSVRSSLVSLTANRWPMKKTPCQPPNQQIK